MLLIDSAPYRAIDPMATHGDQLKRKALIATFSLQLALIGASSAWAAPGGGATSSDTPAIDLTTMRLALARLGEAMTRVFPAASSRAKSPTPKLPAISSVERCVDGAIAPAIVRKMVADEAARQNVDVKLAVTIAAQESSFGANVNSPAAAAAGAMGVMQLTGRRRPPAMHVVDRCDVAENVRGGVSLIRDLERSVSAATCS